MALKSFVEVHPDSHFPIQNLPYGVFKLEPASSPRPGVAIGDYVLDLSEISSAGLFEGPILKNSDCFLQPNLNKFIALGRPAWKEARATLQKLLSSTEPTLRDNANLRQKALVPMNNAQMLLPIEIGDYTDFFTSYHHMKNCGRIFRGTDEVQKNWYHLPIGYHGRASSVVISGTDIVRPRGQAHPSGSSMPYFGPSLKLDFELEMATVVGPGNELGKPIDVNEAADHIFGLVLFYCCCFVYKDYKCVKWVKVVLLNGLYCKFCDNVSWMLFVNVQSRDTHSTANSGLSPQNFTTDSYGMDIYLCYLPDVRLTTP